MHDTVVRTWKLVRNQPVRDGVAAILSQRFQDAGLNRALAEPLASQIELLYKAAHHWLRESDLLVRGDPADSAARFAELQFRARQLRAVLDDLMGFLDRAEDNLGEREEITHRESGYERDVAPFTRVDSTEAIRTFLARRPEFGLALANEGAQAQADLLKVVYLENRLRDQAPKPTDIYAMTAELALDCRRHLAPAFDPEGALLGALQRAGTAANGP
jgi:hypothetical protein